MTTDRHANDALRALVREPVELSEDGLRIVLAAIPDTPQQRSSVPRLPAWRFRSIFSATRLAVAGAIVALFGGFLLAGLLTQPSEESVPAAGASASPEATAPAPTDDSESKPTHPPSDPGAFTTAGSMATPRAWHNATLLPDGRVLIVGGVDEAFDGVAEAEIWDPDTMSFEPAGSVDQGGMGLTTTLLPDGEVLVVGDGAADWPRGDDPDSPADMESWDPLTTSFVPSGAQAGRAFHTATLLPDGRVLLAGGSFWDAEREAYDVPNEVWDPATGSFEPAGPMAEARYEPTATLLPDGRVLIIGGSTPGRGSGRTLFTAEVWDPATESFSAAGSLKRARWGHSATLLPDGRVLVVGGSDYSDAPEAETPVLVAEAWDPANESFSPAGSMSRARTSHTATLLPDGRVLIVGGGPSTAEIWDPVNSSFGPAAAPIADRHSHTATLLPDGRVLIIGGHVGSANAASAEIWSPTDQIASNGAATTSDLLPGVDLVTEEVEPGVYRVVADGMRELSHSVGEKWSRGTQNIVAGLDGSVWRFGADWFFRLGDPTTHPLPGRGPRPFVDAWDDLAVAPDGTLWRFRAGMDGKSVLGSFDGRSWNEFGHSAGEEIGDGNAIAGIEVQADGTLWIPQVIEWPNGDPRELTAARFTDDGWGRARGSVPWASNRNTLQLAVAEQAGGDAWLMNRGRALYRLDEGGWQRQPTPRGAFLRHADVGSAGNLWVAFEGDTRGIWRLARLDGAEWTEFDADIPFIGGPYQGFDGWFEVAPDGSVWFNPGDCDGVGSFDGDSLIQLLPGTCILGMDVAPDGSVWLQASSDEITDLNRVHTYVITPEANLTGPNHAQNKGMAGEEGFEPLDPLIQSQERPSGVLPSVGRGA